MTPELKAAWVAALRSEKYKQHTGGAMRCGDSFCCLGVLADLIDSTRWISYEDTALMRWKSHDDQYGELKSVANLPPIVADLIALNDGTPSAGPRSFAQIADWIENNADI